MAKKEQINLKINTDVQGVKNELRGVNTEVENAASGFTFMGMSLKGVKKGFFSAMAGAKSMFGSIKAGMISSGIGIFIIAIGSLVAYFTKTKRGAEMLERGMAGLGAIVNTLTDLMSKIGDTMVAAFTDPQQAVKDLWEAIKTNLINRIEGMIDMFGALSNTIKSALNLDWDGMKAAAADFGESMTQTMTGVDDLAGKLGEGFSDLAADIESNTKAAMRLKRITQQLRQAENDYSKDRARTMQDIQKARLEALDDSKTAEERLASLQKANELELDTTAKAIELQKQRVRVQREEMKLSENMQRDEDELVAMEVELIDLKTRSFQTQKRLATEMEALTNEIRAKEKADQKIIDDEKAAADKLKEDRQKASADKLRTLQNENLVLAIDDAKEKAIALLEIQKDKELREVEGMENSEKLKVLIKKKYAKKMKDVDKQSMQLAEVTEQMKVKAISNGLKAASSLAGEHKGLAVAQATVDTYGAVVGALNDKTTPSATLRFINAASMGVMGLANVKKILSTDVPGADGSGGGSVPNVDLAAPAQQFSSGAFELSGGGTIEPVQAFVVTDDMSSSQDKLASIRRRATI